MSIEKTIWQTYETSYEDLADFAKEGVGTWLHHNPEWTHGYMSGPDRENFFKDNFSEEVYQTYLAMPLGVMKAGLWRFAILYINGGVYADMDTHCQTPISTWLNEDYDLVLDIEGDTSWYATQVIAAKKGHPFLMDAINLCVERARDGIINHTHMVHYYTDVQMFTDSLFKSLNVEPYLKPLKEWASELNELPLAKENKMFTFGGEDARRLLDRDVKHLYWGDSRPEASTWVAWKKDPIVNQSYPDGFNPHDWKE